MCDIKWIKLAIGMHDDEKMKLIDSMPNRDSVHYFWIRLLIQAGKTNAAGKIFLSEDISYTKEMLSIIFNRPIDQVDISLKILSDLKMIHIDENNIISISNWEKHQNIESMEKIREQTRKRVNKYREKEKAEKANEEIKENDYALNDKCSSFTEESLKENSQEICNVTVTEENKNKIEIKNKIKKETEIKSDIENKPEVKDCIENTTECESNINSDAFNFEKNNTKKDKANEFDVMDYIKKIHVKIKGGNLNSIKRVVNIHGGENVKMAIDKALEVNKPRMNYINGILDNWKAEGYPTDLKNISKNNFLSASKNHKTLSFNNFEARDYDYDKLETALLGWQDKL